MTERIQQRYPLFHRMCWNNPRLLVILAYLFTFGVQSYSYRIPQFEWGFLIPWISMVVFSFLKENAHRSKRRQCFLFEHNNHTQYFEYYNKICTAKQLQNGQLMSQQITRSSYKILYNDLRRISDGKLSSFDTRSHRAVYTVGQKYTCELGKPRILSAPGPDWEPSTSGVHPKDALARVHCPGWLQFRLIDMTEKKTSQQWTSFMFIYSFMNMYVKEKKKIANTPCAVGVRRWLSTEQLKTTLTFWSGQKSGLIIGN